MAFTLPFAVANAFTLPDVNPMSMQNLVTLAAMTGANGPNLQAVSPAGKYINIL
jgi:hypothetical protein